MLVVKPVIVVESAPGATHQILCGVPAFSFSRTIGLGLPDVVVARGVAVVARGVAGVVAVIGGAAVGVVATVFAFPLVFSFPCSLSFPFWSMLMVLWMVGCPGITSSRSNCEFWATPLGNIRNPAVCAGVKLSPMLTGVVPSDSTTMPLVGSPVTWKVTGEGASLGTPMSSALPNTEL